MSDSHFLGYKYAECCTGKQSGQCCPGSGESHSKWNCHRFLFQMWNLNPESGNDSKCLFGEHSMSSSSRLYPRDPIFVYASSWWVDCWAQFLIITGLFCIMVQSGSAPNMSLDLGLAYPKTVLLFIGCPSFWSTAKLNKTTRFWKILVGSEKWNLLGNWKF